MNSEQVLVDKKILLFSLNRVLKSEMLSRKLGIYNTFFNTYEFNTPDYLSINKEITENNLPSGYYTLCDLLGQEYLIDV